MQVVGVDFGTTNVRIATWDSDGELTPRPLLIGQGGESTMPAVIAFQRQADRISTVIGEDADELVDDEDTIVVRNIKRWALSSDLFVQWHLDAFRSSPPEWWNPETRGVKAFGEEFPIWDVIRQILAEAFRRATQAGLSDAFEWRAGCPVQADLEYRSELAAALAEFGGENRVSSVFEEPILFLVLANRLGTLQPGSYLVYDLGGGSFDCALAEVETDGQMVVYASSGDPLRGGSTIDQLLMNRLDYNESPRLLRLAKEQLSPSNPAQAFANTRVTLSDLEDELKKSQFIDWTRVAMREAYISAKVIWKWDEEAPTQGGSNIPSLRLGNMATAFTKDLDRIILFGGSTRSPFFRQRLAETFGAEVIVAAESLIPAQIPDPELTGLSMGACYAFSESRAPLYIRRLPARITLRNTRTGASVAYEPYRNFAPNDFVPNFSPAHPFISAPLPQADARARYELTVSDPDGVVIQTQRVNVANSATTRSPRLVIDALGRIGVENNGSVSIEIDAPPWQTPRQREVLQSAIDNRAQAEQSRRERAVRMFTDNLFGYELMRR